MADLNCQDKNGNTLLMNLVCLFGQPLSVSMAEYMLTKGANIKLKNIGEKTLVHLAAFKGNLEVLKYFHDKGLSLSDADRYGNTPLIIASRNGFFNIVEYLIKNERLDLNISNKYAVSMHYMLL